MPPMTKTCRPVGYKAHPKLLLARFIVFTVFFSRTPVSFVVMRVVSPIGCLQCRSLEPPITNSFCGDTATSLKWKRGWLNVWICRVFTYKWFYESVAVPCTSNSFWPSNVYILLKESIGAWELS